MTRRVEVVQLVEDGWLVKCWAKTAAEAEAIQRACQGVPKPAAFVPFDPEEPKNWPSVYGNESPPPNCQGNNSVGAYIAQAAHDAADGPDDGCSATGCVVPHATDEA